MIAELVARLEALYADWQAEIDVPGSGSTVAFTALEDVVFESLPALLAAVKLRDKVVDAARAVDALLSDKGPPFSFDGEEITPHAQVELLILHDTLNDVSAEVTLS